ncbi:Pr6Pr family membrane protein [Diaminobutyricimonas sp. LJ205]|uniref:Pr6Pr family membrane protein n=1 Tax=Diaminobutyricimonas sp. LJ205 TaxID=2683590 RepID=UPI0012F49C01|nr:Pr6Pr family membrane protein [Diaminobutyricimonas sp. LJ205]
MTVVRPAEVKANLPTLTLTIRLVVAVLIVIAVAGTFFDTAARGPVNPFNFFGYFTIQSNLFFAAALVAAAVIDVRRERVGDLMLVVRASITTYLVIVGSVYATLLAPLGVGSIAPAWANVVLHMITPVYAVLDWLITADRRPIPFSRLWLLVIYPLVWIIVVLIRGATDGWVPYPFLDSAAGYAVLGMYVVAILVAMLTVGSLVILASRAPMLAAQPQSR